MALRDVRPMISCRLLTSSIQASLVYIALLLMVLMSFLITVLEFQTWLSQCAHLIVSTRI